MPSVVADVDAPGQAAELLKPPGADRGRSLSEAVVGCLAAPSPADDAAAAAASAAACCFFACSSLLRRSS
jgi:hypothetical protein